VGQTRCLIWQFVRYTVVLSKIAEAFNIEPMYISAPLLVGRAGLRKKVRACGPAMGDGDGGTLASGADTLTWIS
jgi:hypothetical protein